MTKLLLLIVAIAAVWYGFRWYAQVQQHRAELARKRGEPPVDPTTARNRAAGRVIAEEMSPCPVCGTYVAAGAARCGRPGCPQKG